MPGRFFFSLLCCRMWRRQQWRQSNLSDWSHFPAWVNWVRCCRNTNTGMHQFTCCDYKLAFPDIHQEVKDKRTCAVKENVLLRIFFTTSAAFVSNALVLEGALRKPFWIVGHTLTPSSFRNRKDCDWLTTRQEVSATFVKALTPFCSRNVFWTRHLFRHFIQLIPF